jgi:hypothetical protein
VLSGVATLRRRDDDLAAQPLATQVTSSRLLIRSSMKSHSAAPRCTNSAVTERYKLAVVTDRCRWSSTGMDVKQPIRAGPTAVQWRFR